MKAAIDQKHIEEFKALLSMSGRQENAIQAFLEKHTELEADIDVFIEIHNENPSPYKWVKLADQILASVKRFCHKTMNRTLDSGD